MPLNIPALAARGAALAWQVADTALTAVTVRTGPTITYDPTTDATTKTWASTTTGKKGLLYDVAVEEVDASSKEEMSAVLEGRAKKLLLQAADFTTPPAGDSEVDIASVTWQVLKVTPDPVAAIFVLQLRR